jgi:hypothetical protein
VYPKRLELEMYEALRRSDIRNKSLIDRRHFKRRSFSIIILIMLLCNADATIATSRAIIISRLSASLVDAYIYLVSLFSFLFLNSILLF